MKAPLKNYDRVVAVPYRPKRKILIGITIVAFVLASCLAGFLFTAYKLEFWQADLQAQRDNLAEQLLAEVDNNEMLQSRLVTVQLGADIDRKAAEELKRQLLDKQRLVSVLKEELSFYRNLMNPESGQNGLDAYRFLVYGSSGKDQFRYRLVLQQLGASQKLITVAVSAVIKGELNGEQMQLSLQDIHAPETPWDGSVRFRYYHNLEGQFILPEGFEAKSIEVSLKKGRNKAKTYNFDWTILETTHAG